MAIEYHYWQCEICQNNYATKKEANKCEKQGIYLKYDNLSPGMIFSHDVPEFFDIPAHKIHLLITKKITQPCKDRTHENPHVITYYCCSYDEHDGFFDTQHLSWYLPLKKTNAADLEDNNFKELVSYAKSENLKPSYWDGKKAIKL